MPKDTHAITREIKAYLERNRPGRDASLQGDTQLLEAWFIDSLEIVTMVLFLEKQFGIRMGPGDISAANFSTLNTLSAFVAAKRPAP